MQLIKYLIALVAGIAIGIGLTQKQAAIEPHNINYKPTELELEIRTPQKLLGINQLELKNKELETKLTTIKKDYADKEEQLDIIKSMLGTLNHDELSNLLDRANMDKGFSQLDDNLDKAFVNMLKTRNDFERELLNDFKASRNPSLGFEKVKDKLLNHTGAEKDAKWAYLAESYLKAFFFKHSSVLTHTTIDCRKYTCEVIGFTGNFNYDKPKTEIGIMNQELEYAERMLPMFKNLIDDPKYYDLFSDNITGPYFSILENYMNQRMPFVLYIDRSSRSMEIYQ